jgi:hypothetical protein
MPSKQRAAGRRSAKLSASIARQRRMLGLMRKREPLISIDVLKALAASGLPPHKGAYNKRLKELLGVEMRREKRFAEQQQRYLARQEERRLRKMKSNSLPGERLCHPSGADATAATGEQKVWKTKTAAVAKLQDSSHV